MSEYRTARDLHRLDEVAPEERFVLQAEELRRIVARTDRCRDEVENEREACLKIVEDHLRLLVEERRLDPLLLMESIADRIRRRSEPSARESSVS